MNDADYEKGLGRLLDGEMTPAEAAAWAAQLQTQPERVRDLQQHLALWEVWSQHQSAERSAKAFAAAWETRLAAESSGEDFCRAVQARVSEPAATPSWLARLWELLRSLHPSARQWAALASAAAAVVVFVAYFWLGVPHSSAGPVVTIEGEAVCTMCTLHQTHTCSPAIRVLAGGRTEIYYVRANKSVIGDCPEEYWESHGRRVRATGTATVEQGHFRLDATTVTRTP